MVQVDGTPINASPEYDQADGRLSAAEVTAMTINAFPSPGGSSPEQQRPGRNATQVDENRTA